MASVGARVIEAVVLLAAAASALLLVGVAGSAGQLAVRPAEPAAHLVAEVAAG